ncbi:MAG: disulfide reductase [Proteobacteria bacterium]|nr:disulfide reductase [Desulfobacula sp.]MBU3951220.1 disulfide reductase [Pseudomonadota bacterium]MBU4132657.1 disulfide reductase [Pseudomonadota bacterium]
MRVAYFPGCKIDFVLGDYGSAVETVMAQLGVSLVRLPFSCCGNPSRGKNLEVSVFSAIKNLALAAKYGLDIMTPCKCCFGQLKQGVYWYETRKDLRDNINRILAQEGLFYTPPSRDPGSHSPVIRHLLSFLLHDIGITRLKEKIIRPWEPVKTALQQGCHALRPYGVTGFDNPFAPKMFKALVEITGLRVIDWSKETSCCGNPIAEDHKELSLKILRHKVEDAAREGAAYICTACTHCQIQYQGAEALHILAKNKISAVSYPFILGTCLGIPLGKMGG